MIKIVCFKRSLFVCWLAAFSIQFSAEFARAEQIHVTILHLNDIYEITPVEGGKAGGPARVAALRKELKKKNPNTITILGGDALSPSALGTAVIDGEALAGRQMVEVLNAVGVDYATFGNHEFDLKESQFLQRLSESKFVWISSNCTDAAGNSYPRVPTGLVLNIRGKTGVFRIGLIGLTLDVNPKNYVRYADPIQSARSQVGVLKDRVDALVAITHLDLAQDMALANAVPELSLILGGHEHENIQVWRGDDFTPILKADANVRSVYIVELVYDTVKKSLTIEPRLKKIDDKMAEDPAVAKLAAQWVERGFVAFRKSGFKPEEVVAKVTEPLDGREATVRNGPTNLAELIAQAMMHEQATADLAFYNGGSIRIDDVIPPGQLTQYDVIRILPFGGKTMLVEMSGETLQKTLDAGMKNKGVGGYLHTANVTRSATGEWLIKGERIDPNRTYRAATTDFLMSGREANLDFLKPGLPGIGKTTSGQDIRFDLIAELKARWPASK